MNHLQLANFTLNSVINDTTVNNFTAGFQYWNNLIASNISAPLVTFPDASFGTNTNVPQQSFQRKWQFKDDFSKSWGKHTFKGGVDYIWNPVEGGFFEFSSTLEIDFGCKPNRYHRQQGRQISQQLRDTRRCRLNGAGQRRSELYRSHQAVRRSTSRTIGK